MAKGGKQTQLDKIREEMLVKKVGAELAKSAHNLVFGEGSPDAQVVFIGEAPGKNEDIQNRPFIGAAGKFLDELLDGINLKREDVYITSILKYRPPKNRDPQADEKDEFWPYLLAQLEVIQPKIIVTLGRHSLNCFEPDLRISEVHGQALPWQGKTLLPLYHPAVALYNRSRREILINDFAQLAALLKKI